MQVDPDVLSLLHRGLPPSWRGVGFGDPECSNTRTLTTTAGDPTTLRRRPDHIRLPGLDGPGRTNRPGHARAALRSFIPSDARTRHRRLCHRPRLVRPTL